MRTISVLTIALFGCEAVAEPTSSDTEASTISTPWAIIECEYPDLLASGILPSQLAALYNDGGDFGNLHRYFELQSGGQVDIGGSMVFGPYNFLSNYSTESTRSRAQVLGDCISLALGDMARAGKTPYSFYAINAVIDGPSNDGAVATGPSWVYVPASSYYYIRGILIGGAHINNGIRQDPAGDMAFMAHEMLHAYGLQHSSDLMSKKDYTDPWDIMSANLTYSYEDDPYHCLFVQPYDDNHDYDHTKCPTGPNLSAAYRDQLGWLTPFDVFDWSPANQRWSDVNIAAIDDYGSQFQRVIRIPANDGVSGSKWYVEYRHRLNFDLGLPREAVLIHYFDGSKQYLMNTVTADGGLDVGDVFTDPKGHFKVTVEYFDHTLHVAEVLLQPT